MAVPRRALDAGTISQSILPKVGDSTLKTTQQELAMYPYQGQPGQQPPNNQGFYNPQQAGMAGGFQQQQPMQMTGQPVMQMQQPMQQPMMGQPTGSPMPQQQQQQQPQPQSQQQQQGNNQLKIPNGECR
ncbi:hypothetical protein TRICI_004848 [Trichomonascus ciferrii]|uniref:Uncharacterized protein n=1 Tax=Trichomonascus ciferrii TaxID=44093 RepID=A0A642V3T6_9ASCO|nr:hypothetical protein TRICI_004848 [Trichomonascus ciferrii]